MTLIDKYRDTIIQNLPEWNHSTAKEDLVVQEQIQAFKNACAQIDIINSSDDELLEKLAHIVEQYVPDNHITIHDKDGISLRKNPFKHLSPPQNLATQDLNNKDLISVQKITVQPNKTPWLIGTLKETNTGIIAIPSFGGDIQAQEKERKTFIKTFFKQKSLHKWEHIIFDFRGNTGGDSELIRELAERMCNQTIRYADKSEPAETLTPCLSHSQSDIFKGHIFILQDEYNASAAEGAVFMLSQLQNSKTIGTSTSGTFQGGACKDIQMPIGTLTIGTIYRERFKNGKPIKEKEGIPPDIPCSSENAFNTALMHIQEIKKKNISKELNAYCILHQIITHTHKETKSSSLPIYKRNSAVR